MKSNNISVNNGTELSDDQFHALRLNAESRLEECNPNMLSLEEIEALQRIQFLLDDLKFGRESD